MFYNGEIGYPAVLDAALDLVSFEAGVNVLFSAVMLVHAVNECGSSGNSVQKNTGYRLE